MESLGRLLNVTVEDLAVVMCLDSYDRSIAAMSGCWVQAYLRVVLGVFLPYDDADEVVFVATQGLRISDGHNTEYGHLRMSVCV